MSAHAGDPTTPSPQLVAKINAANFADSAQAPSATPTPSGSRPVHLKLLGLMLRDRDNGTAIVSLNGSRVRVIPLQRQRLAERDIVEFDDRSFVLADFTQTTLVLESPDGSREFLLK